MALQRRQGQGFLHQRTAEGIFLQRLGQGRDKVKDMIQKDPAFAEELEKKIKAKMAEIQESASQKFQGKSIPKADTEPEEKTENTAKQTRAAARAKLDIAVEDDED